MIYINKDAKPVYVELDTLLDNDSNLIGSSWDEYQFGAWILLTDAQIAFKEANQEASVEEVYNMQLAIDPVEPEPSPEPNPLQEARRAKLTEIEAQDKFGEKFFVSVTSGGVEVVNYALWMNAGLRTTMLNTTLPAFLERGDKTRQFWTLDEPSQMVDIPIQWAIDRIPRLEIYATETYDMLRKNTNAVYAATSVEEIAQIDVKLNYPKFLTFELNLDKYASDDTETNN